MKNNILNRILCLTMMALCSICGFAQTDFGRVSSQTADFIRQGNIPVSLYTGQVNLTIPLYRIKDSDFDIPIALHYAGDGLKPNRRNGWAGLNWSVSGAGAVSREIYGAPDDHHDWYGAGASMATKGYYRALNRRSYDADDLYNLSVGLNCSSSVGCDLPYVDNCFYDCIPDLFLFSMPGHSGRFVTTDEFSVVRPICPNSYDFSLAGLTGQSYGLPLSASQITVTSPDGYVYTFGSITDTHSLEYSIHFHPTHDYESDATKKQPRINAWHLTRITAPNGRVAKFNYAATTESTSSAFMKSDCPRSPSGNNTGDLVDDFSYSATKTVLLESIEIEDTGVKVEFLNGVETCRTFYNYGSVGNKYNALGYQLNGIRVKQGNSTIYTCSLEYENKQHLRFLKRVTTTDGGVYTLQYTHPSSYPEPTTTDVDTYGYWSGTGSTPYSLLSSITYPTGGNTTFDYERNTYSRSVERRASETLYSHRLVSATGTLNSFRILRQTSSPAGTGSSQTKEYTYNRTSTSGSGILLRSRTWILIGSNAAAQTAQSKFDYNVEEPIIGYSSVQERFSDGSYKEYSYSDYQSCPDTQDSNFHWSNANYADNGLYKAFSSVSLMTSNWSQRGRLVTERMIDNTGSVKQRIQRSYRKLSVSILPVEGEQDNYSPPYVTAVFPIPYGIMATKIKMAEYPLIYEDVTDYTDSGNTITNRIFLYNSLSQLSCLSEVTSGRDTLKTCYTYPQEEATGTGSALLAKHMIGIPVLEKQYFNSTLLNTKRTVFKTIDNGDVVPDEMYVCKSTGDEKLQASFPVYDAFSNPVHTVHGDGTQDVVVWGYAGRYPVAKIEGVDYTTVKNKLGTEPKSLSAASSPDMNALDGLRNSLPSAHVTTYTHSPLIGVTSITAPNWEKQTYTYDSNGRLTAVKEHSGYTEKQYDYHYKQ